MRCGQDSENYNADSCEREASGQETCGADGVGTDWGADVGGEEGTGNSINVKQ